MAGKRIAGVVFVKVDGDQLSAGGTVTYSMANEERETLVGLSGVVGYKEMPRVPFIELEAFDDPDGDSLDVIHSRTVDATVQAELANGRIAILRNASSVTAPEVSADAGTATMRFEGRSGDTVTVV